MNLYVYSLKSSHANQKKHLYIIEKLKEVFKNLVIVNYDQLETIDLTIVKYLIFSGGDGIFHNIINECQGYDIVFGYIPLGTANDMANNLGIKKIEDALQIISNGKTKNIPLIEINDKFFMYALSVGNMSKVSLKTPKLSKKALSKTVYKIRGIRYFFSKKTLIKVEVNGKIIEKKMKVLIVVHSMFLGGVRIDNKINEDLKIIMINSLFDLIKMFIFKKIKGISTKSLKIISDGIWCFDGEYLETTEGLIKISENKICILSR